MSSPVDLGRGPKAVADMKARIAFIRSTGRDVLDVLWDRHVRAEVLGQGYDYEFSAEPLRSCGERGQPGDG